jgi:hypothetical protein
MIYEYIVKMKLKEVVNRNGGETNLFMISFMKICIDIAFTIYFDAAMLVRDSPSGIFVC